MRALQRWPHAGIHAVEQSVQFVDGAPASLGRTAPIEYLVAIVARTAHAEVGKPHLAQAGPRPQVGVECLGIAAAQAIRARGQVEQQLSGARTVAVALEVPP